eukprot:TRINITY_DN36529_c0_g1_i2.p1 TRINITY_DN36529_c0_g1~~TRINITY_DN36529_c0_g1_i2.p1  ORF type:complete len:442 (+),score=139.23 TRINITY_DN36529_c0_g1_i2:64-1389(+)
MAPKYAAVAMVAAAAVGGLSTACWRCRPPERQAAELLRRIEDRLAAAEALAARAERSGEGALSADAQRAAAQLQAAAAPGGHPPPWLRHAWHGCLGRRGAPVTDEAALRAAWGEVSAAASRLRQAPRKCPPAPADCPPTTEELFVDLVLGADPRTFFPWVPVPVQWGRLADWGGEPERANRTLQLAARRLLEGLRKDVLYVTLSEAPTGLESLDPLAEDDERRAPARPRVTPAAPGLLVLSAGGFGHAAVPLAGRAAGAPLPPPGDRAGGLLLAPRPESRGGQRAALLGALRAAGASFESAPGRWQDRAPQFRFVLAPRGYGRASRAVGEALRLGRVPVYLHDGAPWLPYPRLPWGADRFAVVVDVADLAGLPKRLAAVAARYGEARAAALAVAESHMSQEAALRHVALLLRSPAESEIACSRLPAHSRLDRLPDAPPAAR